MHTQKKLFLLPHCFQRIGLILTVVSTIVFFWAVFSSEDMLNNVTVIAYAFAFLGLFFVGVAKEKVEDEFTLFTRTRSALTAIAVMFGLNILLALTVFAAKVFSANVTDGSLLIRFVDSFTEMTGYGGAFILYILLYKFRLARYKARMEREIQEESHEE